MAALGLGLALPFTPGFYGGGGSRLLIAATGGEIPQQTVAAGDVNQQRIWADSVHKTGSSLLSVSAGWCNYFLNSTRVETNSGNTVTVAAHFRIDSAPTPVVVATFGGAANAAMADGAALQLCDEIPASAFGLASIPAGTVIFVRTEFTVGTIGHVMPSTRAKYTPGGEQVVRASTATTQIGAAGALIIPSGGAAITNKCSPLAVLGRSLGATKAAILFGDSLVDGLGDSVGYGDSGGGFWRRAAWDIGGGIPMPWSALVKSGSTAQQAAANITKQSSLFGYCTHFFDDMGSNDASVGRTPAQCVADKTTILSAVRAAGVANAFWQKIMTRASSSSDSWATVAGQTISAAFANGGTYRDPINVLIATAQSAGTINEVIDADANWRDPTLTDHIRAPGYTADGVHPTPLACALMGSDVAAQLAAG